MSRRLKVSNQNMVDNQKNIYSEVHYTASRRYNLVLGFFVLLLYIVAHLRGSIPYLKICRYYQMKFQMKLVWSTLHIITNLSSSEDSK